MRFIVSSLIEWFDWLRYSRENIFHFDKAIFWNNSQNSYRTKPSFNNHSIPVRSPDHDLQLILLGGFDVQLNGRPLAGFSYNKMRALLAYLAMERVQDHNREVLLELLWAGNDAAAARNNLRRTLSDLRKALESASGKTLFSSNRLTIRFIPNIYVDALDFTGRTPALSEEEAIALYRGEFMAGFSLPDCPGFEDWLQIQRETLHRRALALLEQLSNHHEQTGNYSKAQEFALRYIELEPWDENAHGRVMRLYALNGQNHAAIAQYEACCQLLKKELGVLPNEETRHLAERIRSGGSLAGAATSAGSGQASAAPTAELKPDLTAIPQTLAERRQVTVLHCELQAALDDPDELMERLHMPQAHCAAVIRQFSGHIVQTHGGGLLAYFGYPAACEDAPHRAVRAALAITREAVHGIEVRIGIHTGLIITGGKSSMPDMVGQTSRLAIRMQQSATPDEVVISPTTHQIVAGYFACIGLAAQSLPGFAQPMTLFKVVGESGASTRLDAAGRLTPLIGRKVEISQLLGLWKEVAQGTRHVVLIQGEAGIGKSRLLYTLKQQLTDAPHAVRELRCFAEFSQSPFYPLIAMLETMLGFARDDTPEAKSVKLATYFGKNYPAKAQESVPLLALLLSLPPTEHHPRPALPPHQQKARTQELLLEILQTWSAQQPTLLIFEDLHWIDPSTLEILNLFIGKKSSGPVLVLLTARPEFDPPWNKTLETAIRLAPLSGREMAELITAIRPDIPAATLRQIVERADGVPLFAEEIAKIASLDNPASIPATLHDLLAARMDQLGEAKAAAQLAATIGREFDLGLLGKVTPDSPATLARNLHALEDAGLVLPLGATTRQFKHALIQEAAYQSQTKAVRQAEHIRIAQTLLNDFPDIAATQPEVIAQHFNAGGDARLAIEYWLKAVQRTVFHSANTEAMEYLKAALLALDGLPAGIERDRLEFTLQFRFGYALQTAKSFGSSEALQAFHRAVELSQKIGNMPGLFQALDGLCYGVSSHIASDNTAGLTIARQMLDIAQECGDPHLLQQAHFALGHLLFWIGDFAAARYHHEQSSTLDELIPPEQRRDSTDRICGLSSRIYLPCLLWLQGFPDQAKTASQLALEQSRQSGHPHTLAFALYFSAMLQCWLDNPAAVRVLAEESLSLCQKNNLVLWQASSVMQQGWAAARQGNADGIKQIQQCIGQMRMIMGGIIIYYNIPLAEMLLQHGQAAGALDVLDETLTEGERKNDHHFEAELHRLKGEALMQLTRYNEAEVCFSLALEVSRKQGAKSLALRAAASMARLWQQQGRPRDAQRVLKKIHDGFSEGLDTPDLQQAAGLLRALA